MGRDGFEPSKQVAADLQSVPFGHSGICPCDQHLSSIAHYLHSDKCFITLYILSRYCYFTFFLSLISFLLLNSITDGAPTAAAAPPPTTP